MANLVVAIDGPASSGKGTLARRLAAALLLPHLDTGLLYRAVGRLVIDARADPAERAAAERAALALRPHHLARPDLRGLEADRAASQVAAIAEVRAALLAFQRRFAAAGAVLDGRDIGTMVCPDAAVKLFVTADLTTRAWRRWQELSASGEPVRLEQVEADLRARDSRDIGRDAAPLRPAPDAVVLDTTTLSADGTFLRAMEIVRERTG